MNIGQAGKYGFFTHDTYFGKAAEIAGVFFLENTKEKLALEKCEPIERIKLLKSHIYRKQWIKGTEVGAAVFKLNARIANHLKTYIAFRNKNKNTFDTFPELIESEILAHEQ